MYTKKRSGKESFLTEQYSNSKVSKALLKCFAFLKMLCIIKMLCIS